MNASSTNIIAKRHRNVAHLWADKQVIRFFRKHFKKRDYKNLRSVYLALCEIDSDFGERKEIGSFTSTVGSYAGADPETLRPYLIVLKRLGLIDYAQEINQKGHFSKTILTMYKWSLPSKEQIRLVKKRLRPDSDADTSGARKTGDRICPTDPVQGKSGAGVSGVYKKDNDKSLSDISNDKSLLIGKNDTKVSVISDAKASLGDRNGSSGSEALPKEQDPMFFARRLAKQFCDVYIKPVLGLEKIAKDRFWPTVSIMHKLLKEDGLTEDRIGRAITWLAKNSEHDYVPQPTDAASFRRKFVQIELAMKRQAHNGNHNKPRDTNRTLTRPGRVYRTADDVMNPSKEA